MLNYRNNQISIDGYMESYEAESIEFIRQYEPPEGYYLGFSGGKDSIVCHHLCEMAGVKFQAYYSCTGIDPPEIYKFIRANYPGVKWLYPKMSFWAGIKKKWVPFRTSRWCCDVLKKNPGKEIQLKHRIMGIRAEESTKRAKRQMVDNYNKKQTLYKPIFNWLEWQIWEHIEKYKLPYPSLYDEGFDRIGCIICPFLTKRKKAIAMERWPATYRVFEKVVTEWWEPGKYKDMQTADEFIKFWYNG